MKYLIDTHVLLWHILGDRKLSKKYLEEIEKEDNVVFVSKASLWEIAIKVGIGKLKLTYSILEIDEYLKNNFFEVLDFGFEDFQKVTELPFHHQDPFDRLIISQAITNNYTIITDDPKFNLYPVLLLKN